MTCIQMSHVTYEKVMPYISCVIHTLDEIHQHHFDVCVCIHMCVCVYTVAHLDESCDDVCVCIHSGGSSKCSPRVYITLIRM